jgi:multidrug transporter EmrE-like cation transporter
MVLVFLCTLFGVAAQFLIKSSTQHASTDFQSLLHNYWLWSGLGLYGISTALLVLALRDGELSLLYPVISLTYVWVTILSFLVFHEELTIFKVTGVAVICAGVALLGKTDK